MTSENTKLIAKNTLMLYVRMLVLMLVTLYTQRVVLRLLGLEDYGIYDLIAGIVIFFSFLNTAMTASTQRFLNFEMGRGDTSAVRRVFSMSMTIHIGIAVIMLIAAETIGLWFINTKLVIPAERMNAANWVYQFAILSACVNIIRVPYNASIVAHEKMSFYALVSIAEAALKLCVVFMLMVIASDKLIVYGALTCGATFIIFLFYRLYCKRKFDTCRYRYFSDKTLFRSLLSFTGWSLLGSGANTGTQQGINVTLNLFWGVTVNAAVGIANQLSMAIYAFVSNFQVAFNPQIVKSYAAGDRSYFTGLIFRASKYSYFLLLFIALPTILYTDFLIELWLGYKPAYAADFCRLILVFLLIDAIAAPLWTSVQATGNIRNYQIITSAMILLNLPVVYAVMKLGFRPEWAFVTRIAINFIAYIFRIFYLKGHLGFPSWLYIRKVCLRALAVTAIALPLPVLAGYFSEGLWGFVFCVIISWLSVGGAIYLLGMERSERSFFTRHAKGKLRLLFHKTRRD